MLIRLSVSASVATVVLSIDAEAGENTKRQPKTGLPPLRTGGRGDRSPHRIVHRSQGDAGESEDAVVRPTTAALTRILRPGDAYRVIIVQMAAFVNGFCEARFPAWLITTIASRVFAIPQRLS